MALLVDDLLNFHLTPEVLRELGQAPIICGDDWELRLQVRDADDEAVSLQGALLILTVRDRAEGAVVLGPRRSDTNISGTSVKPLEADAAQGAEVGDTGTGWFTIRFRHEEEAALLAIAGAHSYDLRIRFADGTVQTYARGRIQFVRPYTSPVA